MLANLAEGAGVEEIIHSLRPSPAKIPAAIAFAATAAEEDLSVPAIPAI
ncbi:MAG TPA: hypothetical protein VGQ65_01310 [Thermoanaerobaculia bacterium]|nr:hypothetical protein [Thermoanaerobaculia bacterium]